jgi:hypothetical protein
MAQSKWGNIDQWGNETGNLNEPYGIKLQEFMVIGNKAYKIHKVPVYIFSVGDVEDPEIYAAQPIWEWQQTEAGKWVMAKSVEVPMWSRYMDAMNYGYKYAITAFLKDEDYTYWCLKWGTK